MNVKLYTTDKITLKYIGYLTEYHSLNYETIQTYNEDGTDADVCIILKNVKSVKQSADNIRIDTDKISIYVHNHYINGMFIETAK